MVHATSASVPGQADTRTIVSDVRETSFPTEWSFGPPCSGLLVVKIKDGHWRPTNHKSVPGQVTSVVPKPTAAALAIDMNRRAMAHRERFQHQHIDWFLVVQAKSGVLVSRIVVQHWIPSSPFDLPPDAWGGFAPNVVTRCSANDFNRFQMRTDAAPEFWCMAVKQIVPSDLEAEGGAA